MKKSKQDNIQTEIDSMFEAKGSTKEDSNHQQISSLYAQNFNAIDKFNEYAFSFFFGNHISTPYLLSYLYRYDYPHKYSSWSACLTFGLLYSGIINAWSAYNSLDNIEQITLENFLKQCSSELMK